jgi:hypothetical protein
VRGNSFFAGEVEPRINEQVGAVGAYFGQGVQGIVDRLRRAAARRRLELRGANGSTRPSFNTTMACRGLLEHERAVGASPEVTDARLRGQDTSWSAGSSGGGPPAR